MNENTMNQIRDAIDSIVHGATKVFSGTSECSFSAYKCGTVIRIDIKLINLEEVKK